MARERPDEPRAWRVPTDALDVLRLLQATDTATLAAGLAQLEAHEHSATVTTEAVTQLALLFGNPEAAGVIMAIRAARPNAQPDVISASIAVLVSDLLTASAVGRSTNPSRSSSTQGGNLSSLKC